ncbi:hypothetical protein DFJ43DRAFT_477617 [Lentinula guzmanii]|uniref:Uncharacterized protein n=1 Tax=Lentinula guzmanii TaxID=2804957 RepID=A0AA38MZL0_9AGAR|nr:hypothetical protein DFJ43DRAFT_477617 [Lentinula guzmanii]
MTPIVHKQSQIKATYRQPLAELPLTNFCARPSSITNPHGPADIPEHISYLETPVIIPRTPLLRSSDNIARFRQGYVQPPLRQIIERSPTVSIADASSLHQPSSPQIATTSVSKLPGAPYTIDSRSEFKPAAHAFARAPASTHGPSQLLSATKIVPNAQNPGHLTSLTSTNAALSTPIEPTPALLADTSTTIIESKSTDPGTIPLPPQTLRQRRSPFREGRRFIPLDDSDTSDDEQRQIGFL